MRISSKAHQRTPDQLFKTFKTIDSVLPFRMMLKWAPLRNHLVRRPVKPTASMLLGFKIWISQSNSYPGVILLFSATEIFSCSSSSRFSSRSSSRSSSRFSAVHLRISRFSSLIRTLIPKLTFFCSGNRWLLFLLPVTELLSAWAGVTERIDRRWATYNLRVSVQWTAYKCTSRNCEPLVTNESLASATSLKDFTVRDQVAWPKNFLASIKQDISLSKIVIDIFTV